jgi:hypothetical protein
MKRFHLYCLIIVAFAVHHAKRLVTATKALIAKLHRSKAAPKVQAAAAAGTAASIAAVQPMTQPLAAQAKAQTTPARVSRLKALLARIKVFIVGQREPGHSSLMITPSLIQRFTGYRSVGRATDPMVSMAIGHPGLLNGHRGIIALGLIATVVVIWTTSLSIALGDAQNRATKAEAALAAVLTYQTQHPAPAPVSVLAPVLVLAPIIAPAPAAASAPVDLAMVRVMEMDTEGKVFMSKLVSSDQVTVTSSGVLIWHPLPGVTDVWSGNFRIVGALK